MKRFTLLLAMLCLVAPLPDAIAYAADPRPPSHEIPPGPLDDVLQALAAQSRVQLLYSPALVRNRHSQGLKGARSLPDALSRLLSEHGLTAVSVNPNTYLLQSTGKRANSAAAPVRQQQPAPASVAELASVEVTGTRIPRTSLELSFPVTVITAQDIERSGQRSLYELLGELPGFARHHPVAVAGEGRYYPTVVASSGSLYGLGPRGTLYLLDGRRIASFGLASSDLGGIVDLGRIPLAFIERIEILRAGASAVYGADAMAGTVNIILKKDPEDRVASSRLGVSQRGDALYREASALLGTRTRAGGSLMLGANLASQDELGGDRRAWHTNDRSRFGLQDDRPRIGFWDENDALVLPLPQCRAAGGDPASPYCRFDSAKFRTLQPGRLDKSLYARWEQPLGDTLSLHASGLHTRSRQELQFPPIIGVLPIPPSHPDYPGPPATSLYYVFQEVDPPRSLTDAATNDVSLGVEGSARGWHWSTGLSYSESRVHSTIDNVFLSAKVAEYVDDMRADGSDNSAVVRAMQGSVHPRGQSQIGTLEVTADRPLFEAYGVPAQFEIGASVRHARRRNAPDPLQVDGGLTLGTTSASPYDLRSRDSAVFAELALPLYRSLQADLAVRLDQHAGFRANVAPRLGLKWAPIPSLMVRASVGEGYRPPSLSDLRAPYREINDVVYMEATPELGPCIHVDPDYCEVEYGSGDNPHLRAEHSRNLTAGLSWTPTHAFSASLDGYRILRTDEFGIADASRHPSLFPEGLVRDADGVLYRANTLLANIGRSEARGWEFRSRYFARSARFGDFGFDLAAHHLDRFTTSSIVEPRPVEMAGHEVPRLTVLGNVRWQGERWAAALNVRHLGPAHAYRAGRTCPADNRAAGKCTNPPMTLLGLDASYSGPGGWSYSLAVSNLLDRSPRDYRAGTDGGYNAAVDDAYGRYFTLTTSYRF